MDKQEIRQSMKDFAVRVLKGDCTPQEAAILPEVLKILLSLNEA